MAKKTANRKMVINLNGPEGNAFHLLGVASGLAKKLKLDGNKIGAEMQESDYENLIFTFKKYFGDYIELRR